MMPNSLDTSPTVSDNTARMANPVPNSRPTVRLTESDLQIVSALSDKLGVGMTQIFRLAIRALATKEKVTINSVRPKRSASKAVA